MLNSGDTLEGGVERLGESLIIEKEFGSGGGAFGDHRTKDITRESPEEIRLRISKSKENWLKKIEYLENREDYLTLKYGSRDVDKNLMVF